MEKVKLLNIFFVFAKSGSQESQTQVIRKRAWEKEDILLIKEDLVRYHLGKLNTHRSMGHNGMHM